MKNPEAADGHVHQEALFEIAQPEAVVVPVAKFEDAQERKGTTLGSQALQQALEDEEMERRIDNEADKLGSYDLALERMGVPVERPLRLISRGAQPHVNHYHPSKVSDGDSENDPYWQVGYTPLTADQNASKEKGLAQIRTTLHAKRLEEIQALPTDQERLDALRADRVRAQIKQQRKQSS